MKNIKKTCEKYKGIKYRRVHVGKEREINGRFLRIYYSKIKWCKRRGTGLIWGLSILQYILQDFDKCVSRDDQNNKLKW